MPLQKLLGQAVARYMRRAESLIGDVIQAPAAIQSGEDASKCGAQVAYAIKNKTRFGGVLV